PHLSSASINEDSLDSSLAKTKDLSPSSKYGSLFFRTSPSPKSAFARAISNHSPPETALHQSYSALVSSASALTRKYFSNSDSAVEQCKSTLGAAKSAHKEMPSFSPAPTSSIAPISDTTPNAP